MHSAAAMWRPVGLLLLLQLAAAAERSCDATTGSCPAAHHAPELPTHWQTQTAAKAQLAAGNYGAARHLFWVAFNTSIHRQSVISWDDSNVKVPASRTTGEFWEQLLDESRGRDQPHTSMLSGVLRHDLAQFEYLANLDQPALRPLMTIVAPVYQKLLTSLAKHNLESRFKEAKRRGLPQMSPVGSAVAELQAQEQALDSYRPLEWFAWIHSVHHQVLRSTYGKAIHLPGVDRRCLGSCVAPRLLSEKKEPTLVGYDYMERYLGSRPSVLVIDDLLSESALTVLGEYFLQATVWYHPKPGYVGAYMENGAFTAAVQQLAEELHLSLPEVFCDHKLRMMWAYRYHNHGKQQASQSGIDVHADQAAVNVNIWLTELDQTDEHEAGGMVIYTALTDIKQGGAAAQPNHRRLKQLQRRLRGGAVTNITVPYQTNRATIFDSSLYHETSPHLRFPSGYEKGRINLTLLFGEPGRECYS